MESQHDVFISHSSSDSKLAYAICHYLEEREIRCWIAPRDIQGGMEYAESIISAIKGSRVMVVVFSENANSSLFVKNEVERAFNYKSIIIPFKVDDTIPSATLELFLGSVHWLDAVNGKAEDYFDMLYQNCAKSIGLDFKLKKNNKNTTSIPDNTQDEHILINSDEKPNIENEVSIGVENENHATTIKIKRYSRLMHRFTVYKIMLDENSIGTIKNGQEVKIEIPNGSHKLYLRVGFWTGWPIRSNIIDFELGGETAEFNCGPNPIWIALILPLLILITGSKLIWLKKVTER